ncbi:lipopolysaccharide biosynthesis protein [Nitrosomonas halophila]|uniref:Membrane protein involved in the export of O-antigen and teichoic acid n=1 Tax=Nitrosomonas halophila TaxID=44576 RepID=A0A1H3HUE2_9PROT|nr:polysaccharide biosynthesis C-terminal domain-containing protein [Nitrosomonas halophila]SDY19113.1 Membrane protein involved in the export of O-antigen and teichoic acid [Nitrosomonas halophila]
MLLRHSIAYLLARGGPGLVNFAALAIYTRLLNPDEYGRYALVIAGISFFNVVFFQWLRSSLLRFLPSHLTNPNPVLGTLLCAFAGIVFLTGLLGATIVLLSAETTWKNLIALAIPLLWMHAWIELNLELARSSLQPRRYGTVATTKAVSALVLGVCFVMWGLGEFGPLLGMLAALLIVGLIWGWKPWTKAFTQPSNQLFMSFLKYGMPLTATFALGYIISTSDRFLVVYFLDEAAAGLYSAAYDLGSHTLIILLSTINLAAYPLAVRALEQHGVAAAQAQLRRNAILLLSIGLPSIAGFMLLSSHIADIVLGADFREQAASLLPWVAISVLFAGFRAYYFDLAFQLGRRTIIQTWIVAAAAGTNLVLNILLIPEFGVLGAAYATAIAYGLALLLSGLISLKYFQLPLPWQDALKILLSTILMVLVLSPTLAYSGLLVLLGQVVLGVVTFGCAVLAIDAGGYRSEVLRRYFS